MTNATDKTISMWMKVTKLIICLVTAILIIYSFLVFNPLGLEDCTQYCYSQPCLHRNVGKIIPVIVFSFAFLSIYYLWSNYLWTSRVD